eukprot:10494075-Alexandrium_andersonii.AAC.1
MSASLVGSEMCIRDRAQARQSLWPKGPLEQATIWDLYSARRPECNPRSCLLYTSDGCRRYA